MRKSDKYFGTALLGYFLIVLLTAFEVVHIEEAALTGAWVATLALPLCIPRMARALEMEPYLWLTLRGLAQAFNVRRQES